MKKNLFIYGLMILSGLALVSCDKFLDVMPDNRAEIDTIKNIQNLLRSAYLDHDYQLIAEFSSDNVQCLSDDNPYTSRFIEQVYEWKDITESNNSDVEAIWSSCYNGIAAANYALQGIDELGGPTTDELAAAKGEALVCRAYLHFILVNMFSLNYNSSTSNTDLGIHYMTEIEHTLHPHYERGTVAEVYANIEKDLEEGLPLIADAFYQVPKYHFNQKAAYAFAARFFLYYEKWDKVIEYADKVLGTAPKTMLRDYAALGDMTQTFSAVAHEYINAELNCNLMMMTGYSSLGLCFGPYYTWAKYASTPYVMNNESANAVQPWGQLSYYSTTKTYPATNLSKTIFWRATYDFEYTDAVAGIGYYHTVCPAFTADECLLNRAEAYIMLNEYEDACDDLTLWVSNVARSGYTAITPESVQSFYAGVGYSNEGDEPLSSTVKKRLHPAFDIGEDGGVQESMLQAVLTARRIETVPFGLRWFDVKRYGIEICRVTLTAAGMPGEITDKLSVDDKRRAIQIPKKVIDAGHQANTRY